MSSRFQSFGYRDSQYERPNQDWVCGRACDGEVCPLGPSTEGKCRADYECVPICHGDRWECTRSPMTGGPCEDGPHPDGTCCRLIRKCQPVRSVRAKRAVVAIWVSALTLGLVCIGIFGPWKHRVLSPGALSLHHGQIMSVTDTEGCAVCHGAATEQLGGWIRGTIMADPTDSPNHRCLMCHANDRLGDGKHIHQAHSVDPDVLARVTAAFKAEPRGNGNAALTMANLVPGMPAGESGELACATCHVEHKGVHHDIKGLTDLQCQVCHSDQFAGFTDGHPEFDSYPHKRRSRIIFDHQSHSSKHFEDREVEFQCASCHVPDPDATRMLTLGFEETCRSCHGEQIEGRGMDTVGIAVLGLPGIDVDVLSDNGLQVGAWPEDAMWDIDGKLTPFMKLLLDADTVARDAIGSLPANFLLNELDTANPQQLEAVATIAWRVKLLMYELAVRGQSVINNRLNDSHIQPGHTNEHRTRALPGGLSPDIVAYAVDRWFPDLADEITGYRSGAFSLKARKPATPFTAQPAAPKNQPRPNDDSLLNDDLLNDEPPSSTVDLLLNEPADKPEPNDNLLNEDDSDTLLNEDDSDALLNEDDSDALLNEDDSDALLNEDDSDALLAEDDSDALLTEDESDALLNEDESDALLNEDDSDALLNEDKTDPLLTDDTDDPLLSDDDSDPLLTDDISPQTDPLLVDDTPQSTDQASTQGPDLSSTQPLPDVPHIEQLTPEQRVINGGWYVDQAGFVLRYRLSSHADPFLRQWLDVTAAASSGESAGHAKDVFDLLSKPKAPGLCMKCHSRDLIVRDSTEHLHVNWKTKPFAMARGFTKFQHAPHLLQPQLQDCTACHAMKQESKFLDSFQGTDPYHNFDSGFHPINRSTCASCHQKGRAGESCLRCHNYHVGTSDLHHSH